MSEKRNEKVTSNDLRKAVTAGVADMSRNKNPASDVMQDFTYGDFINLHNEVGGSIRVTIIALKTLIESLDLSSDASQAGGYPDQVRELTAEFAGKSEDLVKRFNVLNAVLEEKKIKTRDLSANLHVSDVDILINNVATYQELATETASYFEVTDERLRLIGDVIGTIPVKVTEPENTDVKQPAKDTAPMKEEGETNAK